MNTYYNLAKTVNNAFASAKIMIFLFVPTKIICGDTITIHCKQ